MAINLKTEEGFEFSFDTVEELMEFTQRMNAVTESTSDEGPAEDEIEVPETEPKFEVGDEVKVVENKSSGHSEGTIGEITEVSYVTQEDRWSYGVDPISGYQKNWRQWHKETDLELSVNEIEVGDKVRVVSAEDGSRIPYHGFDIGSIGEVVEVYERGKLEVLIETLPQTLLPHHYVKVESLGKDANGEDLYEGDYVTGSEDNDYGKTNDTVVMKVEGAGESILFRESNIRVKIDGDEEADYRVDSSKFIKLSDNLDEAKARFYGIKEESELLPVGTKVRLLSRSACGDLRPGDVGIITHVDEVCPVGFEYSVRVRGGNEGRGWVRKGDVEVVEEEREFRVGDRVRVVGNSNGHRAAKGEVLEIKEVDSLEPKYNLSDVRNGYWASTSDIEHADSPIEFKTGDIVRVTEAFEDTFKDRVTCGAVYNYDENLIFGDPFVGTVFLGDNRDKIELVCRAEDRLDK